ncbi:MAG: arsenate reductase ArsC [Candidatus Heimdallarchaeota archaeon]
MEDPSDPSKPLDDQNYRKSVLFLCTHNSARSQMAEGILKAKFPSKYKVYSAGTHPTSVKREAIQVMKEVGIDISRNTSKGLVNFLDMAIDYVVTVCDTAKENCPYFPGAKEYIHKSFDDPSTLVDFRRVRNQIQKWIINRFAEFPNPVKGNKAKDTARTE